MDNSAHHLLIENHAGTDDMRWATVHIPVNVRRSYSALSDRAGPGSMMTLCCRLGVDGHLP